MKGSGWTSALVQADIASTGTADSFIKVSHVTKTRHAHQIMATCIHALLKQAYDEYTSESGILLPLEQWCLTQAQQSLSFNYWLKTLSLEILLLLYARSIREGSFQLYIESLVKITPWMFALDHIHYSRWLPVHICDIVKSIQKSWQKSMHESTKQATSFHQWLLTSAMSKIMLQSGAIGLTTDPLALRHCT